jgi:hypothetical protein
MAEETKNLVARSPDKDGRYFIGYTGYTDQAVPVNRAVWVTPTEFVGGLEGVLQNLLLSDTDKHHLEVILAKPETEEYKKSLMALKYLSYKRYTDLDYEFDRIPFRDLVSPNTAQMCLFADYSDNLQSILRQIATDDPLYVRTSDRINIKKGHEEDFKKVVHKLISKKTVGSSLSDRRVNFFPIDYPKTLTPDIVSYAFVGELNKKNKMMVDSINSSLSNLAPQKSLLSYPIDAAKQGYRNLQTQRHVSTIRKQAIARGKEASSYPFASLLGYKKGDPGFITNWGGTRKRQLQARRV